MNFKEATNRLKACPGDQELADAAGVSVQAIRQARMHPESAGYRPAPVNWREAVIRLAEERIAQLRRLIEDLRA